MNDTALFQEDFYWITRNRKAIYSWLGDKGYRFFDKVLDGNWPFHPGLYYGFGGGIGGILSLLLHGQLFENPLFDTMVKALVRAESRLCSRFLPQRSHEERLTGNLVSEIDSAFFLIRERFRALSQERYGESKVVDFYYYDLSRGGKAEKITGADLGLIFVLDLPDLPFMVRSLRLQAKKVHGSSRIDIAQLHTLTSHGADDSAYLFYDMDPATYCAPIVYPASSMEHRAKSAEKESNKTFSISYDDVLSGIPLSLFAYRVFSTGASTQEHAQFKDAYHFFERQLPQHRDDNCLGGRIAIISLGRPIAIGVNNDGGLELNV